MEILRNIFKTIKANLHTALYIFVFVLVVPVLGITSNIEFLDFKINDRIDYNEWTVELGSKLETDIASSFYRKFDFVNLNGLMRNVLFQQEMNSITKLNNGKLAEVFPEPVSDEKLLHDAYKTAALRDFLEARGSHLLFVMCPYGISPYDEQLPAGVTDYSNQNVDRFLAHLDELGVDTIDIREELHAEGISQYDMMYRTDHHWNTDAGFYTYGKIEDYIVGTSGCKVDARIRDITQYEKTVYPKHHLGMYGQRTGKYFGGIDDFVLYMPTFNTLVQLAGSDQAGNMQSIFYHTEPLEDRDHTSRYTYDLVLGEDPFTTSRYINHSAENDIKILVLSNSFYKSVAPYMVMGYADVTYFHAAENVYAASAANLLDWGYDYVIMLYEPSILYSNSAFDLLSDLEDN